MTMLLAFALLLPAMVAPVEMAAHPTVSPAGWISAEDYPRIAIEAEEQGTVGMRFIVGRDGWIRSCSVEQSSGSAVLDATACALVRRRGRYTPARDLRGNAVEQAKTLRFTWRLPDGAEEIEAAGETPAPALAQVPPAELKPFAVVIELNVDGEGVVSDCRTTWRSGAAPDATPFCDAAYSNPIPVAGGSGAKAHKRKLIFRSSISVEEADAPAEEQKPRRTWREPA